MAEIRVGDLFPTYSDFEARLKTYEKPKSVDLCIADSRTLISVRMRCPLPYIRIIQKLIRSLKRTAVLLHMHKLTTLTSVELR